MSITLEKRKLTLDDYLNALGTEQYYHLEEMPRDKDVVIRLNTTDIVILSFIVGIVLSIIAALVYKVFTVTSSQHSETSNNTKSGRESGEDYSNVGFAERTPADDFDYPYEDIGDALK